MNNTFSFQQIAAPKVLSAEVREAISNNVLQFYVRDQQQDTQDEGITALYERLSQEDKLEGESNSIANQKKILERYCREHGITAYRHYDEDDGYSGTNFNRPGFQRMLGGENQARYRQGYVPFWTRLFASRFLHRYAVSRFWRAFYRCQRRSGQYAGRK